MEVSGASLFHFPVNTEKKSKHTISTSALFKKSAQLPPSVNLSDTKRKRDKPTKYDLTSKPHGIRKRVLKNNAVRTWQKAELEKPQLAQRSSLSSEFNEATSDVRKNVVSKAEALLHEAQSSILGRIDSTYGTTTSPSKQKQQPKQPDKPAKLSKGPFLQSSDDRNGDGADSHHKPTSSEKCRLHNDLIARLTKPFAEERIVYTSTPELNLPATETTLGDVMEAFRATVAADEKRIAALEAEWEGVQDEIRTLARSILCGSLTPEEWASGMRPSSGLDAEIVEKLRREVVDTAEEFERQVVEMNNAEKALKKRQERFLADTIRSIGEL